MTNPLLQNSTLPLFKSIKPEHIEPAITELIERCRKNLDAVVEANKGEALSWNSLVQPLEEMGDQLNKAWSPVSHLNAVMNSSKLRGVYEKSLAKLTAYGTELGQRKDLYDAYLKLSKSSAYDNLEQQFKMAIDQELRDFKLAGVALPEAQKQRYAEIQQRLSELSTQFSNRVLDATQAWNKNITDLSQLSGIPENSLALAQQAAENKNLEGYLFTLELPSYLAVMMYADDRQLRQEIYTAYVTRASDVGPNAGEWDNREIMDEILKLRHELAQLLGFENYAERSLATKMASDCDEVEEFLVNLAEKSRGAAERDLQEVKMFAHSVDGINSFEAWDLAYYSEKLKQDKYTISQEALRPYFPVEKVISGLFEIVLRLFDVKVVEGEAETWHEDVKYYQIQQHGEKIAGFYFDIFARENKRGGAWMDECRSRRMGETGLQLPVAYMVCNFTPPVGSNPALLTHTEVVTLFHEFGHGLHHMLTKLTTSAVSGIHGVAWDAVELPSQFLENWCWEKEAIPLISGHHETGEALPEQLLNNLLKAKNFQSALQMLRQIEFSLFDFRLHRNYNWDQPVSPQQVINGVREQVAVFIPPEFNRFQNSFTHIFSGGYAAGYYSYKWAEVLSSDAFSRFEEEGIFNSETGQSFLQEILQQGGAKEAMELFKNFRGREPDATALLRHSGILN